MSKTSKSNARRITQSMYLHSSVLNSCIINIQQEKCTHFHKKVDKKIPLKLESLRYNTTPNSISVILKCGYTLSFILLFGEMTALVIEY
jgi:hypothetical protein